MAGPDLVIEALRRPAGVSRLDATGWDLLVRQARRADLLGRLGAVLSSHELLDAVPPAPRAHFEAALRVAKAQHVEVGREVRHVLAALEPLGVTVVLLKGAAYTQAGLPAAMGRTFSDIDILVPKARLMEVESHLLLHGWMTTHHTPYDQRYYRQWMHELPPLVHMRRQTALDVHHAILPETARVHPDSAKLRAAAVPVPGQPGLAVLAPVDMVLHSMVHLLLNEELSHGLRDLSDLDLLLRHFGASAGFWGDLVARAGELGLGRSLHYGLRCVHRILGTPVPEQALRGAAAWAPPAWLRAWMDLLWIRALRTPHASAADLGTHAALGALYLRAHWLRMPPVLLTRHLLVKALRLNQVGAPRRA